jgi:hypothetical protein
MVNRAPAETGSRIQDLIEVMLSCFNFTFFIRRRHALSWKTNRRIGIVINRRNR